MLDKFINLLRICFFSFVKFLESAHMSFPSLHYFLFTSTIISFFPPNHPRLRIQNAIIRT